LTFTGAPPSGTNNIYVVHQAKSVGTIDVPDDIISGKTLVTLDNSNDHVLIEDATDGELKKALIPAASFAGIDDQTSSNDDQLTITDTAVVVNEDSDDVDFRVESNGNANMLFVSGGNDVVGIGNEGDLGTGLHIKIADTSASVNSAADELVIEGTSTVGMSFLTNNDQDSNITFGDSDNNERGRIQYAHDGNKMHLYTDGTERIRINGDGSVKASTSSFSIEEATGVYHEFNQTTSNVTFRTRNSHGTPYGNAIAFSAAAPNNTSQYALRFDDTAALKFIIYSNGNVQNYNNSYGATSDIKLKEQVADASSQWDDIKNFKVRKFKFKKDVANGDSDALWRLGLIAQEAETVSPNLIESSPDRDPSSLELTGESTKAIKYSVLYMKAIKCLQEAQTRIETLETEMTALKARVTTLEE
jgi:hypothetical protein